MSQKSSRLETEGSHEAQVAINQEAFDADLAAGKFKNFGPVFVAYFDGKYQDFNPNEGDLFDLMHDKGMSVGLLVQAVNIPLEPVASGGSRVGSDLDTGGYGEQDIG